jgi:hypothetical protein
MHRRLWDEKEQREPDVIARRPAAPEHGMANQHDDRAGKREERKLAMAPRQQAERGDERPRDAHGRCLVHDPADQGACNDESEGLRVDEKAVAQDGR